MLDKNLSLNLNKLRCKTIIKDVIKNYVDDKKIFILKVNLQQHFKENILTANVIKATKF